MVFRPEAFACRAKWSWLWVFLAASVFQGDQSSSIHLPHDQSPPFARCLRFPNTAGHMKPTFSLVLSGFPSSSDRRRLGFFGAPRYEAGQRSRPVMPSISRHPAMRVWTSTYGLLYRRRGTKSVPSFPRSATAAKASPEEPPSAKLLPAPARYGMLPRLSVCELAEHVIAAKFFPMAAATRT